MTCRLGLRWEGAPKASDTRFKQDPIIVVGILNQH